MVVAVVVAVVAAVVEAVVEALEVAVSDLCWEFNSRALRQNDTTVSLVKSLNCNIDGLWHHLPMHPIQLGWSIQLGWLMLICIGWFTHFYKCTIDAVPRPSVNGNNQKATCKCVQSVCEWKKEKQIQT